MNPASVLSCLQPPTSSMSCAQRKAELGGFGFVCFVFFPFGYVLRREKENEGILKEAIKLDHGFKPLGFVHVVSRAGADA